MKKIISLLLILVLTCSLAACTVLPDDTIGNATPSSTGVTTQPSTAPTEPSTAPTEPSTAPTEPSTAPTEPSTAPTEPSTAPTEPTPTLDEGGVYNTVEDVALYIHLYGRLPKNYYTKKEIKSHQDDPYAAVGGDTFGNREGLLPQKAGRTWTECDIDTWNSNQRGAKRIVFSNDGLIYYTSDHYRSFTLLYGEP